MQLSPLNDIISGFKTGFINARFIKSKSKLSLKYAHGTFYLTVWRVPRLYIRAGEGAEDDDLQREDPDGQTEH